MFFIFLVSDHRLKEGMTYFILAAVDVHVLTYFTYEIFARGWLANASIIFYYLSNHPSSAIIAPGDKV